MQNKPTEADSKHQRSEIRSEILSAFAEAAVQEGVEVNCIPSGALNAHCHPKPCYCSEVLKMRKPLLTWLSEADSGRRMKVEMTTLGRRRPHLAACCSYMDIVVSVFVVDAYCPPPSTERSLPLRPNSPILSLARHGSDGVCSHARSHLIWLSCSRPWNTRTCFCFSHGFPVWDEKPDNVRWLMLSCVQQASALAVTNGCLTHEERALKTS